METEGMRVIVTGAYGWRNKVHVDTPKKQFNVKNAIYHDGHDGHAMETMPCPAGCMSWSLPKDLSISSTAFCTCDGLAVVGQ
jgi:hypothetical protein